MLKENTKKGVALATLLVTMILSTSFLIPTKSFAVKLESRENGTAYPAKINTQFQAIREMEEAGGTLGLNATIAKDGDWTDLTNGAANGIDAHLAKTTEWGAAAILSISSYGVGAAAFYGNNNDTLKNVKSTGNETGVYGLAGAWEYNAGIYSTNANDHETYDSNANYGYLVKAHSKYKVVYGSENSQKDNPDGSALDFKKWLGASYANWVSADNPVFIRGVNGLFSRSYVYGSYTFTARAVLVCGSGL